VALAVVREIADRRCARSRDAPIRDYRPNLLLSVANLKKFPGKMSSVFSTSTTRGGGVVGLF
jgi:hypothetical protein